MKKRDRDIKIMSSVYVVIKQKLSHFSNILYILKNKIYIQYKFYKTYTYYHNVTNIINFMFLMKKKFQFNRADRR